jgi:hypothetical protein
MKTFFYLPEKKGAKAKADVVDIKGDAEERRENSKIKLLSVLNKFARRAPSLYGHE